ncbi:extracellular solute-binding protein [Paenibacillus mucilaginosus]|uniref:Family 1 extracellular solute-binding protein n=2 Tax=Paenibacillus mucilaginosus TaxID=61624 RepID=H6NN89_9BACL|nr:extracellular solute-binding protein [Paenibacillus mucilaginosus]AEI44219.1 extracellular solute-binding protein family 1 [Paenibacillus mucilaginosus KNP414]AFC31765.1 family 1 extracellular solute-binding protein [Paenibacillus mucilaginosus 3016]MCG7216630.1 extracellular solute-binding protein [Paenibacillus mucilaginosus]WDM25627.1 extracellular solute-binding protein [Paenibacillus mucilaginosus]WFA20283.1 extracellular solute-binding protein [Paenibacillus mucilaginosus]
MRTTRSILTLLLSGALVFTAACSNNGGESQAPAKEGEAAAVAADPNAPGWKADTSPITFDWYLNFSWFPNKWGVDPTSQYITKKTGVNLNFIVPAGNENEKLNTMIASGKLPDFITLGWYEDNVKKMIEGGLVLPLNKLAEQYDPYFVKVADPAKVSWYTQPDGSVYGYPNASSSPKDYQKFGDKQTSNQTFVVRKDMYEALGRPDMRTPEGFVNALKAAKEKFPEVNGQPLIPLGLHEFGDTGNYSLEGFLQNFLAIPMEKDGKLYDRYTDSEYLKWLKTLRKANEMGLLAKDIFIDKRPQMEEKISQGRYFAMMYQRTDFAAQQNAIYAKDPNSVYIAVDGPANAKGDPPTLAGPAISGWTVTLISKDVKDKARAIRFLTYLLSEEGQKDMYLGEKGVTYDTIDGKDQFKPEVLELLNKDRSAFDKKYGASHTFWMLMDTNMNLQWAPPAVEPAKQLEDWTKGKTRGFSQFDQINPTGTSEEGIAQGKITQAFGKTLPKLLLAKSDAEFDQLFEKFLKDRQSAGYDKVKAYQQKKYDENVKKLEQFMK